MLKPYEKFFILTNDSETIRKLYKNEKSAISACFAKNGMAKLKSNRADYRVDTIVRWKKRNPREMESSIYYGISQ